MKPILIFGLMLTMLFSFNACTSQPDRASRENATSGSAGKVISDSAITTEIKLKLADDELVSASDINVDTTDKVVELNGIVPNQQAADRAILIARNVEGVKDVRSNLSVQY